MLCHYSNEVLDKENQLEGAPSISEQETPSHGKETPEEPGEDCYIKCVEEIR